MRLRPEGRYATRAISPQKRSSGYWARLEAPGLALSPYPPDFAKFHLERVSLSYLHRARSLYLFLPQMPLADLWHNRRRLLGLCSKKPNRNCSLVLLWLQLRRAGLCADGPGVGVGGGRGQLRELRRQG